MRSTLCGPVNSQEAPQNPHRREAISMSSLLEKIYPARKQEQAYSLQTQSSKAKVDFIFNIPPGPFPEDRITVDLYGQLYYD